MYAKKILVPVDFSDLNDAAIALASNLASDTGAKLMFMYVDEPTVAYGGAGDVFYSALPDDHESLRRRLKETQPTQSEVGYEHHLLNGDPASEIVHFAAQEEVDLIVMGTHGRSGLTRFLMGSVAEAVVRRAPCPVFTLKQPVHELAM